MPKVKGKISAKKLRKLLKEKRARLKTESNGGFVNKKHDITAEPVSNTVECSGGILNEGLCDDATEQKVASGSVCDHSPESCDITEYVVASTADATDPFVLSADPPECNSWSVWAHNPPELCDNTQFEVATIGDTTVRDRQLKKKRERSRQEYYENHEKNLMKAKKYHSENRQVRLNNFKKRHASNREEELEAFKDNYAANREKRLKCFKDNYATNREERLKGFKDNYASNLEQRKKIMNDYYASHSQQIKDNAREHYAAVANTKNAKLRQNYRIKRNLNPPTRSVSAKKRSKIIARILQKRQKNSAYYKKNFLKLRRNRRARYNLAEPKIDLKNRYIAIIRQKLAKNIGVQKQLKVAFDIDKSLPIAVMQS
uniref:Uncharacterized protein n=1 Tax=Amphimedon queenslandica TaxID=400682 RepID=A0A1X7SNB1_AMPQE